MYALTQSSTSRPLLFMMIDSADHVSGKTGLSPTVTLSKNGASFASPSGAVTELANGWYQVAGNATDTGTLGVLLLHATGTGADPTDAQYEVVAYNAHDAVRLGLTALPNAAAEAAGGLYTRGTGAGQINQPANGLIDANVTRFGGTAGTFASGRPEVNTSHVSGTAQTARDLGAVLGALNDTAADGDPTTTDTMVAYLKQLINTLEGTAGVVTFPAAAAPANAVSLAEIIRQIYNEVANIDGASIPTPPTAAAIADQVWDEAIAGHLGAGSTGASLNGAGSAGDPWTTALPGAYGAGTAGKIVGDNLNATVGSRATQTSVDAIAGYVDTEVAAIKAKTDNLPASPAAVGSAMTLDLTQAVPTSNTAQTVGDALNAARAQGFGKWALSGTTLTLYAANGTTVVRTFTLDSSSAPTSRT